MPEEPLPIYNIRDFQSQIQGESGFYLMPLEHHLRDHTFIQRPHKHDFYILLLITHGSGTHTIDFNTYQVQPDTFFFLSPGQVHSWQLSADTRGFILFFSLDFYLFAFPQKKLASYPFVNSFVKSPFVLLSANESISIQQVIQQLEIEYLYADWRQMDVIRNYLDVLLIQLSRVCFKQNAIEQPASHLSILQTLENLIEQHFREHHPISFYADKLNLTVKQLNDSCKHSLGKTTSDVIQERIILEARRLLVHSDLTVTQIAAELGYFDNSYFSRFFRKKTGKTPEQFRSESL